MKTKILTIILFHFSLSITCQIIVQAPKIDLKSGYNGFASWCDYNADGFFDVFVTGYDREEDFNYAMIYKNNGDKTFSESGITNLKRVIYGASAWGDYDNNGTTDLLYGGTTSGYSEDGSTKLYKNINGVKFEEISHNIPNLCSCYFEWVDVDNDGVLDIYFQGINSEDKFELGIMKNIKGDIFERVNIDFEIINGGRGNCTSNTAKWFDFNNDGLKDVIIASSSKSEHSFIFYKNLGDFHFEKIEIGLPKLNYVKLSIADINQDGNFDIVFIGSKQRELYSYDKNNLCLILNHGDLKFTPMLTIKENIGLFINTMDVADFDNDGYDDIAFYGNGSRGDMLLIKNNKDNTFDYFQYYMPYSLDGGASFGDYDGDNDLDLLYYGEVNMSNSTKTSTLIFENIIPESNKSPLMPSDLKVYAINNDVQFQWGEGTDDHTNSKSLTYNLRFGSSKNPDSLVGSNAKDDNLKVRRFGNMNNNRSFRYSNLSAGDYTVSVQSIDNAYNASKFTENKSFCFQLTKHIWGDTISICEGDSLKLEINEPYTSLLWNDGLDNAYVYAKKEGLYNVNIINDDCIRSETVFIKTKKSPIVNLGKDINACLGDSVTINLPESDKILWNTNSIKNNIVIYQSGNFWVKVTNSEGCSTVDSINVVFNEKPSFNLGEDLNLKVNEIATLSIDLANHTYNWSNGLTSRQIQIEGNADLLINNLIWAQAINEFQCSFTDSILINLSFNNIKVENGIRLYPLPLLDKLIIELQEEVNGETSIQIYDIEGNLAKSYTFTKKSNTFYLPIEELSKGIYFLLFENEEKNIKQKVQLIK